jgi:3-phenylpropionate/trans-cinnamate dioxygenase ferredoxin reductase subunit
MSEHFVIVGGGQAAAQAIATSRQLGFEGRITLIGAESLPPYQRPPLSKKYLAGELSQERLYLRPPSFYAEKGAELLLGSRAEELRLSPPQLALEDGRTVGFDRLLLATGSKVRRLAVPGADLPGVHYLRTISDARGIADGLHSGGRLVIIGAGYIGLEVAAVAVSRGMDVTVLEAADRVMARVVCPQVSAFYHGYHTQAGVTLHCGLAASRLLGNGKVEAVEVTDGRHFPCDLLVIGVGVEPEVDLARSAGLACEDGIVVDGLARTDDPRIVAAGDCTSHPSALYKRRVRLESVHNAIEQAKVAASTLLQKAGEYTDVPWFWSDQYDLKLQIAGLPYGHEQIVIRGIPSREGFSAFYVGAERLLAVEAVNRPRDFIAGKKLIASRTRLRVDDLANEATDLMALAKRVS